MKVAVECHSPLLQKSLEIFLEKYLSSTKKCDIVVRDKECLDDKKCFYISSKEGADLMKPFSKSQLILALEKRYKQISKNLQEDDGVDFSILEKRIEQLTQEYQANILKAVKAFYGK